LPVNRGFFVLREGEHRMKTELEITVPPDLLPAPALNYFGTGQLFEMLKRRLVAEFAAISGERERQLRVLAEEAAALAGTTAYPLLVFPELFAEKARASGNQE
jgi:hypothetical protein